MLSESACIFCRIRKEFPDRILEETNHWYSVEDLNPVSKGHVIVVLKRHLESFFDLTSTQFQSLRDISADVKLWLEENLDPSPDGFNIGINEGEAAGRTVHHLHVHIIPRYVGDVDNPRGGVRAVIPGMADYPH